MTHLERHRTIPRSLQIAAALGAFVWAWLRLRRKAPQQLPECLRSTLEQLWTTFVVWGDVPAFQLVAYALALLLSLRLVLAIHRSERP